jgi:anti-sigma factor RsiW
MSCSSIDLKAYVLGEANRQEQAACENHVAACAGCREELAQLTLTQTALRSLVDEEIPQRIAFVSDKVFEPKWWQTIWRSGPAMVFASAVLLSSAIFVHAYTRPGPAPVVVAGAPVAQQVDTRQIEAAVAKAVAEVEKREDAKTALALTAAEKRYEFQLRADQVRMQETVNLFQNKMARMLYAANYTSARNEQ